MDSLFQTLGNQNIIELLLLIFVMGFISIWVKDFYIAGESRDYAKTLYAILGCGTIQILLIDISQPWLILFPLNLYIVFLVFPILSTSFKQAYSRTSYGRWGRSAGQVERFI